MNELEREGRFPEILPAIAASICIAWQVNQFQTDQSVSMRYRLRTLLIVLVLGPIVPACFKPQPVAIPQRSTAELITLPPEWVGGAPRNMPSSEVPTIAEPEMYSRPDEPEWKSWYRPPPQSRSRTITVY